MPLNDCVRLGQSRKITVPQNSRAPCVRRSRSLCPDISFTLFTSDSCRLDGIPQVNASLMVHEWLANEILPVIEVSAGRTVDVVVSRRLIATEGRPFSGD